MRIVVATDRGRYVIEETWQRSAVLAPDGRVYLTDSFLDAEIWCWRDGTVDHMGVENYLRRA